MSTHRVSDGGAPPWEDAAIPSPVEREDSGILTEILAGEFAQRLGPRAILGPARIGRVARGGDEERVAFALDGKGLGQELGEELGEELGTLAGGQLEPFVPLDASAAFEPREVLFRCERSALAAAAAAGTAWAEVLDATLAACEAPPRKPVLMGVVNVTPDSFSDGGRFFEADAAIEHGLGLAADGAGWLDVGGESTRPGATPVSSEEELRRVLPVVQGLVRTTDVPVSIDTTKASVAEAAAAEGATLVNDISAGTADPGMLGVVARSGVAFVAMHRQGDPQTMQSAPAYTDPIAEVTAWLRERLAACLKAGIESHRILLDPGIGFGKRLEHNLSLLRRLPELRSLGRPLLLGVSRKSFIGHLTGSEEQGDWRADRRRDRPSERLGGTAAAVSACVRGGAEVLRVHDVRAMAEAALVTYALAQPTGPHS